MQQVPAIHQNWGNQLDAAVRDHKTKYDISQILGSSPIKCEDVPGKPQLDMLFSSRSETTVLAIEPNGQAAAAGIVTGDKMMSVDSKPIPSFEEVIAFLIDVDAPKTPRCDRYAKGVLFPHPGISKKIRTMRLGNHCAAGWSGWRKGRAKRRDAPTIFPRHMPFCRWNRILLPVELARITTTLRVPGIGIWPVFRD
jgi:hypothetical protein